MIHIVCRLAFVERVCHFVLNFSTCRLQSSQNQSLSLHVWITWSLFTLLAALGPHHLLLDSQHHPCYKSQVAPFNMHYFVSRNNSPNSIPWVFLLLTRLVLQISRHFSCWFLLPTDNHASTSPLSFYRPDALPAAQPAASKHWRRKNDLHMV